MLALAAFSCCFDETRSPDVMSYEVIKPGLIWFVRFCCLFIICCLGCCRFNLIVTLQNSWLERSFQRDSSGVKIICTKARSKRCTLTLFHILMSFYCCAMLCNRSLCRHAMSVYLSVCMTHSWTLSKQINISSDFFTIG